MRELQCSVQIGDSVSPVLPGKMHVSLLLQVGGPIANESKATPETDGMPAGRDSSRATAPRTPLDSRENLRKGACVLDWLIVGGGIHGALLARVLVEEAGVAARPPARARSARRAPGPVSPVRGGDRPRLPALLGGAPPRRRPDVPAPLRRAPRAAWRAPRHLPAAVDRPVRRSLRRGDGAPRPAHRVGTRRSARDRRAPRVVACGSRPPPATLTARRVVLAVGSADQPLWPAWAEALRAAGAPIRHVFEPGFRIADALAYAQPVVLGGGLSAFQLALWLAVRRPGLGHPARPPRCADSRVRRRLAVDGAAGLARVRAARRGRRRAGG